MNHQFDLGSAIQPQPFIPKNDPDAPMLASVEGVAARLSAEEVIFQPRRTTDSRVMTMQVLELMGQTRSFRSIDAHVAQALRHVPGLRDPVAARKAIEVLRQAGLMRSDEDFLGALRVAPQDMPAPAPFAGLCIRACDRPAQVERLLASLGEYEARFAARRPVLLFDDSRDRDAAARNRRLLEAHAKASGAAVTYVDPDAGERVAKLLRKALPQHGDVAGALLQQAPDTAGGRTWNLLLLCSAGRRLAMLDEDFVFPLRRHPQARDGLDPSASRLATVRFFDSLDASLAAGTDFDTDPIERHLDLLGRPVSAIVTRDDLAIDRQDLRGLELADLAHFGPGSRIVTTMVGTRGASGSSSNAWLYELDEAARQEFWRDRDSYLRNIEAGSIWYGHPRARCARQAYFTPFSLDNSRLVPCTTTRGRKEDALFATLLRFCQPESLTLHLPQSIGHVQETQRKRSEQRVITPNYAQFLFEQLQQADVGVRGDDPEARMHLAAATLENIAGAGDAALAAHLREYLNYFRAGLIERLQQQLVGSAGAPVYWQADVRALVEHNARAMVAREAPRLEGWPADLDDAGCAAMLRVALRDSARTLRAWPELWAFARDHADDVRKAT